MDERWKKAIFWNATAQVILESKLHPMHFLGAKGEFYFEISVSVFIWNVIFTITNMEQFQTYEYWCTAVYMEMMRGIRSRIYSKIYQQRPAFFYPILEAFFTCRVMGDQDSFLCHNKLYFSYYTHKLFDIWLLHFYHLCFWHIKLVKHGTLGWHQFF